MTASSAAWKAVSDIQPYHFIILDLYSVCNVGFAVLS